MRRTLLLMIFAAACANTPQREEAAPPLVVPPLDADAAAPAQDRKESRREVQSPLAIPARDPRPAMRNPRSNVDIMREIATLQSDTTPSALHTVADDYCELARVEANGALRLKAISTYDEIANKYPTYAALDEVLYFSGLESEIQGDTKNARYSYYELIKRRPNSEYVPYAYFAFGELFFEEAKTDPSKNALAEQAYREVLKYPSSPLRSEAQGRIDDLKKR